MVQFKEGVIAPGDPIPALVSGPATSKVRLKNVVRNAVEVPADRPLTLKLWNHVRVRMALGAIHGAAKSVTFTITGGDKIEKLAIKPDQGWVELDLTFPAGVDAVTVSTDTPSGAFVASPHWVTAGPYRLAGLFIIDALRADALGVYGAPGDPSPNIDRFAKQSAVFTRAHTASSFTLTSVASIFTGLWPWQHRVIFSSDAGLMLAPDVPTLVENFRAAGYRTAAFSGTYFSFADNGFARGFELMDESCADKFFEGSADCLAGRVKSFLEAHADEPVFLYVHFVDTHAPYNPPEPFRSRFTRGLQKPTDEDTARGDTNQFEESRKLWQLFRKPSPTDLAWLRGLYQGEVAYVDDRMGPVLTLIEQRCVISGPDSRLEPICALVLTADHGEAFGEHDANGHIAELHEPVMRVPLIVYHNDSGGSDGDGIDLPIRTIDIMPSLLRLSGVVHPTDIPGRGLFQRDASQNPAEPAATPAAALHFVKGKKEYVLVMWPWKLFYRPDKNLTRLYNLDADPGETTDLSPRQQEKVKELMSELERQLALPPPGGQSHPADPETLKRLHDLGYIQGRPKNQKP